VRMSLISQGKERALGPLIKEEIIDLMIKGAFSGFFTDGT
jgi:hypothetical protein